MVNKPNKKPKTIPVEMMDKGIAECLGFLNLPIPNQAKSEPPPKTKSKRSRKPKFPVGSTIFGTPKRAATVKAKATVISSKVPGIKKKTPLRTDLMAEKLSLKGFSSAKSEV